MTTTGPRTPQRRKNKFAGVANNTTQVTADTTTEPLTHEPSNSAEMPQEAPKPASAGQPTEDASSEAHKGNHGDLRSDVDLQSPPAVPDPPATEPDAQDTTEDSDTPVSTEPGADDSSGNSDTTTSTELVIPKPPPSIPLNRILRQQPTMDPGLHEMYTDRITKLLKSIRNIGTMLADRQAAYETAVQLARNNNYPEQDLNRLAVQFDWEVPHDPNRANN
jgi:hypothetical protein